MFKLKLILGIFLLLAVGALAGSLGTKMYHRHLMERFEPGGPPPLERIDFIMGRLSEDLELNHAQQIKIRKIVEETEKKIFEIRHRFLPEIKEIMDQSFERMKSELDTGQLEKLETLKKKLLNMHRKADRHGPPQRRNAGSIVSGMKERLKLTAEQEAEIRQVIEAAVQETHRPFGKPELEGGPPLFSMKPDKFGPDSPVGRRIAEILTEQQRGEFRKMHEERRGMAHEKSFR